MDIQIGRRGVVFKRVCYLFLLILLFLLLMNVMVAPAEDSEAEKQALYEHCMFFAVLPENKMKVESPFSAAISIGIVHSLLQDQGIRRKEAPAFDLFCSYYKAVFQAFHLIGAAG